MEPASSPSWLASASKYMKEKLQLALPDSRTRPRKFSPVLLSNLLKWAERADADYGVIRRCKTSLEDDEVRQQELSDGCPYCTLLHEAVWKLYGEYLDRGGVLRWHDSFPRVIAAIRDEGGNPIHFSLPHDGHFSRRLTPFPNLGFGVDLSEKAPAIPRDTSSESTLRTVKAWLHECTSSHPLCSAATMAKLPTRVVAIGPGAHRVRVHETKGATGRYACLSHPWGKRPLLRTLTENLSDLVAEIPWEDLPPTFQDAIDFTRRLGLEYIWIDSLCIVQDDPLDWQREAAQMADIYQNAHVTLAASKAYDSSRGLYTSWLDPPRPSQRLSLVNDVNDTEFPLYAYSELVHIDTFLTFFPITRRAWIYQERLLSARVIHFAGAEVNWECRSARMCECGKISSASSLPEKIQFSGSLAEMHGQYKVPEREQVSGETKIDYSRFSTALLNSPKWTRSEKGWRQTVQAYCHLNLSYPKDRFPALAGIAKVWNPQYKSQYLAGLWRESLHLDLLWLVYKPELRPPKWRAPSWSWAALDYANEEYIRFDSDPECRNTGKGNWFSLGRVGSDDCAAVADIPEARCVPAGIDPTGELSAAHLLVSTFALPGTVVNWPGVLTKWGVKLVVGDLWVYQGDPHARGFQPDTEVGDTKAALSMPVHILRITDFGLKTAKCPEMACIVVRQREPPAPGGVEYERVGYVRFVERGFAPRPAILEEQFDLGEPAMEDWLTDYQLNVWTLHERRTELEKTELEWLRYRFEEAGRQNFRLV